MAATPSENIASFIDGIAGSLADSNPAVNRITSRTEASGESETYYTTGEQISALRRAVELEDLLKSREKNRSFFRPIKLTRN